jgi:sporulation protein YlmC with PRC-barrel domain
MEIRDAAREGTPHQAEGAGSTGSTGHAAVVPLGFGAGVHAGGKRVGTVEEVAIDPASRHVTHLIVRAGWATSDDDGRVAAPAALVARVDGDAIVLDASDVQFYELPRYDEEEVPAPTDWDPRASGVSRANHPINRIDRGEETTDSNFMRKGLAVERVRRGVPEGAAVLHDDLPVAQFGDDAGTLRRLLVDAATGEVTHFVVRRGGLGPFFGKEVLVPAAWAQAINDDGIVLGGDGELDALPEYRAPDGQSALRQPRWG